MFYPHRKRKHQQENTTFQHQTSLQAAPALALNDVLFISALCS
jgi:hypothetical protein